MPKLPECNYCQLYAHSSYLVCAIHPSGPSTPECLDFAPVPSLQAQELWEPEGASYYGGELILNRPSRWTPDEQLELLDTHPLFTGRCPECGWQFSQVATQLIHWDCPECGWKDDSV